MAVRLANQAGEAISPLGENQLFLSSLSVFGPHIITAADRFGFRRTGPASTSLRIS